MNKKQKKYKCIKFYVYEFMTDDNNLNFWPWQQIKIQQHLQNIKEEKKNTFIHSSRVNVGKSVQFHNKFRSL